MSHFAFYYEPCVKIPKWIISQLTECYSWIYCWIYENIDHRLPIQWHFHSLYNQTKWLDILLYLLVAIICYAIMIKQLLHVSIKAAHVYV